MYRRLNVFLGIIPLLLKRTNFFPSLVTVSTQIPILGWEERYITPSEGARIQSLGNIELPENIGSCFSALGNAVNATIVKLIANELIQESIIPQLTINGHNHDPVQSSASNVETFSKAVGI